MAAATFLTNEFLTPEERERRVRAAEPDQSTYWGRARHFFAVTNPLSLFASNAHAREAAEIARRFADRTLPTSVTVDEVVRARALASAAIHHDTGEPVNRFFRMSAQVPVNMVIVAGMLNARSPLSILGWQTTNQTLNVCVNYANRNASNTMSTTQIAKAYAGAVSSSVIASIGLNELVKRVRLAPSVQAMAMRFVPFVAVATANVFNVGLMRQIEMSEGIAVKDADGNVLGKSPAAGKLAVMQTIVTRIVAAIPVMVFPPIILSKLETTAFMRANPRLLFPLNCLLVGLNIFAFLPLTIALFPQMASVPVDRLEPQFRGLTDAAGRVITSVQYNKGL